MGNDREGSGQVGTLSVVSSVAWSPSPQSLRDCVAGECWVRTPRIIKKTI